MKSAQTWSMMCCAKPKMGSIRQQRLLIKSVCDHLEEKIFPRTAGQAVYFKLLRDHEVVFGLGPAGTGKTYMAVAWAVDFLKRRQVERIILSRPAVEAGERLGFLPGDMKEKVDPYLRPLYDALYDMMPSDKVDRMIANGEIEIAPLAFMRGRTLSNAFVIIDEAQNTTPVQMKMVLTRLVRIRAWQSRAILARLICQVASFPAFRMWLIGWMG